MSQGSEAITAVSGGTGNLEVLEDTAEASAPTIRVPYSELGVYLPNAPILINGKPYTMRVHRDRLASITGQAEDASEIFPGTVKNISVELGSSLPAILEAETVIKQIYNPKNNSLDLKVPREVTDGNTEERSLAALVENSLSEQLHQGFLERIGRAIQHQRTWRMFRTNSLTVAPIAGTATGMAFENYSVDGRLGMGFVAAGGVAVAGFFGAVWRTKGDVKRGIKWGQSKHSKGGSYLLPNELFRSPAISLKADHRNKTLE